MIQEAVEFCQRLLNFIDICPTPWHVVAKIESVLRKNDFISLDSLKNENELQKNGRYFYSKNGALIAFVLGDLTADDGISMVAAHTDSPGLRLRANPMMKNKNLFVLSPEIYGGALASTFADRDLGLAGRVIDSEFQIHSLNTKVPVCRLANLPIHLNKDANTEGIKLHPHYEMNLLFSNNLAESFGENERFEDFLKSIFEIDILAYDLIAYPVEKGAFWGLTKEFIAHRQLDNLISTFAALESFVETLKTNKKKKKNKTKIVAFFDHEEIGSHTDSGAAGVLINGILNLIFEFYNCSAFEKIKIRENSFLMSVDAAHAFHPNFPQKFEPNHSCLVNNGVALKINRNKRYVSDFQYIAQTQELFKKLKLPLQIYEQRANIACGSTVGPLLNAAVGVGGVDLGVPLWAMHSARESAGTLDCYALKRALAAFLN